MSTKEQLAGYVPTIGIECHVQFKTKTKLFAAVDNDERGKAPNTTVSPICFGLPGTLPVLNEQAVEFAVRAGLAMNAQIPKVSGFDRKHYFYPDLPKGYQITQLDAPIVGPGYLDVPVEGRMVKVRIHHAHLEEDAGKSTHPSGADYSLVDLNRAGTPLLEIVSEADMHSAAEAKAYVQELYLLMKYAGVTHGDLQHGNMRFDVNISIAKQGEPWGTRCEIKNLNSFRAVERAVEYEVKRQAELLVKGEKIKQETRGWDEARQKTIAQRSKEEAMDYRYFPEPDLPPLELTDDFIDTIRKGMPKLPPQLREELESFGIGQAAAEVLILQDALSGLGYVPTVLAVAAEAGTEAARYTSNFFVNRDIAERQKVKNLTKAFDGVEEDSKLPTAKQFIDVHTMFAEKELNSNAADRLLIELRVLPPGTNARELAEKLGLLQENDESALEVIVDRILADPASAQAVADIKAGNMKAIGYLVGQAMKASKGKANPGALNQLIQKKINN